MNNRLNLENFRESIGNAQKHNEIGIDKCMNYYYLPHEINLQIYFKKIRKLIFKKKYVLRN